MVYQIVKLPHISPVSNDCKVFSHGWFFFKKMAKLRIRPLKSVRPVSFHQCTKVSREYLTALRQISLNGVCKCQVKCSLFLQLFQEAGQEIKIRISAIFQQLA